MRASKLLREIGWLGSVAAGLARARTFGLAAEMSFWIFLALVPLAAVVGLVAARIALSQTRILSSMLSSVPPSVQALITEQAEHVAAWRGKTVAPAGVALFVWLASSGVHAMFDGLEVQSATARPWWKKRLLAIGTCIALSIGVALLSLCASGIDRVLPLAGRTWPPGLLQAAHGPVGGALRWLVFALGAVAIVAGLYRIGIPGRAGARATVFPGAILAVVLQSAFGWAYGLYIAKMGTGDAYQAGLAVVGLTLMTIWVFSVALLLGVQLNCVIEEARTRSRPA